MNEHTDQARSSLARWIWRIVYIISPAAIAVFVFQMGSGQPTGSEWQILGWFCWLFIWIVFVTFLLRFKWRDSVFLAWGSPLSLALFVSVFITASAAYPINTPHRVLEVPLEAYLLAICAAGLLLGFVVGPVGSILRLCSWVWSRNLGTRIQRNTA